MPFSPSAINPWITHGHRQSPDWSNMWAQIVGVVQLPQSEAWGRLVVALRSVSRWFVVPHTFSKALTQPFPCWSFPCVMECFNHQQRNAMAAMVGFLLAKQLLSALQSHTEIKPRRSQ